MSSNFILQVRKFSGDPTNLRFKLLAEKLSQFEAATNQLQTGDIKNSIKVTASIVQYKESDIIFSKPKTTIFYLALEPDGVLLKCWFKFDAWGKVVRDASFSNNTAKILGQTPTSAPGPDRGQGGSIAMNLDGSTQFLEVTTNSSLALVGQATGFTVAFLVQPQTLSLTQTGENRYLAEKTDDVNNLWGVYIDSVGKIHFNVKFGGTDYSKSTTTGALSLNAWTWVVCTFAASTHTATIYFNSTSQTLSTDTVADSDYSQTRPDLYIGATAMGDGFFDGWFADFRYYREKVLSSTEVTNLATNMLSISSIAFGQVSIVSAGNITA